MAYEIEPAQGPRWSVEGPAEGAGSPPSRYTVERTQLPQDQRSQAGAGIPMRRPEIPSLRQERRDPFDYRDVVEPITPRVQTDPRWGEAGPPPIGMTYTGPQVLKDFGGRVMERYEERVAKPTREMMFKRDPMEVMAERITNSQPGVERLGLQLGAAAVGALTDPLNVLGGAVGLSQHLSLRPTPLQPSTPLTAPVQHQPAVGITDLARQHQDRLLQAQPDPTTPQAAAQAQETAGSYGSVGEIPTGSLQRGLESHRYSQRDPEVPFLSKTPTGSLLQPEVGPTAHQPYTGPIEGIALPSQRSVGQGPAYESPLPPSRPLHGRPELREENRQGPPAPPLKSAEDVLAERLSKRTSTPPLPDVGQSPPELTSLMFQPEQMGPRSGPLSDAALEAANQTGLQRRRAFLSAYDAMDAMGPTSGRLADILRHSWDYSEQGTRHNFLEYLSLVRSLYADRPMSAKAQEVLTGNWSDVLNWTVLRYGMTRKERDALVELHEAGKKLYETSRPYGPQPSPLYPQQAKVDYSKVLDLVSTAAKERLAAELQDPRLQRLFEEGWQLMTGRVSALPEVQAFGKIHDPVTGTSIPVGPPSPFWPHQPKTIGAKIRLNDAALRRIYRERNYADTMDFQSFKERILSWATNGDDEVQLRRYHGLESPRYLNLLEDANSHNRTVAESLRYYGYEDDPLRVLLRHNMYGLKRSVFLKHDTEITQLMNHLDETYGAASPEMNWIGKVISRSQGTSLREDSVTRSSDLWRWTQGFIYPALLKGAWRQNIQLQPNYAWMTTGAYQPLAEAIWRQFGKNAGMSKVDIAAAIQKSGADFPAFLSSWHAPEGFSEQYNKTMNTVNWFNMSDRTTRLAVAPFFGLQGEYLIRQWWKDPANKKWQEYLREGGLNPQELMMKMSSSKAAQASPDGVPPIPSEAVQRYAQVFTNKAMGRTGVRALPFWLSGEGDFQRLFLMLRRQISSNEAVMVNAVTNAPTVGIGLQRGLRILFGAQVAGLLYNGVTNWIVGNGFLDLNQSLKKQYPNHQTAIFLLKNELMGLGTLTSSILLSGLYLSANSKTGAAVALFSPAAANVVNELLTKLFAGKLGSAAAQVSPLEAPSDIYRRQQNQSRKASSGGSLNTSPSMGR